MVKIIQYMLLFFILLFLLSSNVAYASASTDEYKLTFDDFLLECLEGYVPGELYIWMRFNTDIQSFLESIPPIKIEFIEDVLADSYFSLEDAKMNSMQNNSLFHIRLADRSDENLYKVVKMLLQRNDVKSVSPNPIDHARFFDRTLYDKIPSTVLDYMLVKAGDDRWVEAEMYDYNNDGIIDVDDMIIILAKQRSEAKEMIDG